MYLEYKIYAKNKKNFKLGIYLPFLSPKMASYQLMTICIWYRNCETVTTKVKIPRRLHKQTAWSSYN